ncbi:MAG: efflux RND transporter periplasmic adaptor subunit [Planctomycetota bacterium]
MIWNQSIHPSIGTGNPYRCIEASRRSYRRVFLVALLSWGVPCGVIAADPIQSTDTCLRVSGLAIPSQIATLTAVQQGRIANMAVIEGISVREGDVLFTIEDSVQRARTEMARWDAESSLGMERGRARWEHANRNLQRLMGLQGDDFASSKELADAQSEVDITQIEYQMAKFVSQQAQRAYERERATLAQYTIVAPFPGYVSEHFKEVGETVEPPEPVLRLLRLDPLEVVVDGPLSLGSSVHIGDEVNVQPVDGHWAARVGKVTFLSRAADAASQTLRVKVEVPNDLNPWIAGLKVNLVFQTRSEKQVKSSSAAELTHPLGQVSELQGNVRRGG